MKLISTFKATFVNEAEPLLKGAGIAALGAILTYFTSYVTHHDFGMYTPLVVSLWSIAVNYARKWIMTYGSTA